MRLDIFDTYERPPHPHLTTEDVSAVAKFIEKGFGASEWFTQYGGPRRYYFNLDKAYSYPADLASVRRFHDVLARFLLGLLEVTHYRNLLAGELPVLAYVCPDGAPAGILQTRGALAERLGWPSVLVFPGRRLLRSRVISGGNERDFPAATGWLAGRHAFLLCDAVTTGRSAAQSSGALRSFGGSSMAAIAVFNRDEGAEESLALLKLPLVGLVNPEQARAVIEDEHVIEEIRAGAGRKTVRDYSVYVSQSS